MVSKGIRFLKGISAWLFHKGMLIAVANGIALMATGVVAASLQPVLIPNALQLPVPINDDFDQAVVISTLPFRESIRTDAATKEATDPILLGCAYNFDNTLWYRYTATQDTIMRIQPRGNRHMPIISVWSGTGDSMTEIACAYGGRIDFNVTAGTIYHILIADQAGESGQLVFTLNTAYVLPTNTVATGARAITAVPFTDLRDFTAAIVRQSRPVKPSCGPAIQKAMWYAYTPTVNETINVEAYISFHRPVLALWSGKPDQLAEVSCVRGTAAQFQLTAGQTYYLMVAGNRGAQGYLSLNISTE
jgi:hypothetical protein